MSSSDTGSLLSHPVAAVGPGPEQPRLAELSGDGGDSVWVGGSVSEDSGTGQLVSLMKQQERELTFLQGLPGARHILWPGMSSPFQIFSLKTSKFMELAFTSKSEFSTAPSGPEPQV